MTTIFPGAIWRPIPAPGRPRRSKGRAVIFHVAVSEGSSLFNTFAQSGNDSHLYVRRDGTCLTPQHKVLTADLRWVPLGELHVGDHLVGFDETTSGVKDGRKYREAIVEWLERDEAEVYAVVLDDERIVYTTADHRWLTQQNQVWTWRQTLDPGHRSLVGARIPRLFDTWEPRSDYAAGWFAGILDGEGTLTAHHRVGFSQRPTMVLDRALEHLKNEGFEYNAREVDGGRGDCQYVDIQGVLPERMRLLGSHRPSRLLDKVRVGDWGAVRASVARYNKVIAVYPVGVREIVKMQTSTRTFVAEGFGMHNCEQYIDLDLVAYASMAANASTISVETQGGVTNPDGEPWTPQQLVTLARIARWAHDTEGVPLQVMPDSLPASKGIGWHRLGIDPWRVAGGEVWSSSRGKLCPGAAKIAQVPGIVQLALTGDVDMQLTDRLPVKDSTGAGTVTVGEALAAAWEISRGQLPNYGADGKAGGTPMTGQLAVEWFNNNMAAIRGQIAGLQAVVTAQVTGQPLTADQIQATVEAAVKQALTDNTVHVDVNVAGAQPATS